MANARKFMKQDRLLNVDALRGFALLGILAVNIGAFADPYFATPGVKNPLYAGPLDQAVRFLSAMLFEAKFYLLFSFLFGYSFTLQMTAAERAGAGFRPRMLRRSVGLVALGILHGCLLFFGDILHMYGLLCLILLRWHRIPLATALWRARALVIASAVLVALVGISLLQVDEMPPDLKPMLDKIAAFHGSAAASQAYIMAEFPTTVVLLLFLQAPSALGMFLLGLAAGRCQLFARVDQFRHLLPRVLRVSLPLGLAGAVTYAGCSEFGQGAPVAMFGAALNFLVAPFLTLSYVVALLMLFDSRFGPRLIAALAPMGKIALTNYLLQSAVMAFLFTGYGLRLCNELPPVAVLGVVLLIYFSQMALSAWWLRRYSYGPAEWVLRAVTNWAKPGA